MKRRRTAGSHKNTRPDDAPDAQQHQIPWPQRALEFTGLGFGLNLLHGLSEQHSPKNSEALLCGHLDTLQRPQSGPIERRPYRACATSQACIGATP